MKPANLFLSFFALFGALSVYAVESDPDRAALGVQAGLNFETAKSPAAISTETHTGFSVGVNLDIPIARNFSILPELIYSRRGLNLVDAGSVKANVYHHALDLPVLAKLSFGERVRPYVFVGPMATWNISSEVQGTIAGQTASSSYNPEDFDFALIGGLGLDAGPFFANLRYVLGIVDIEANSADWKSRGFRLMAGLRF